MAKLSKPSFYLPEFAILFIAALVRFWRLDYHSIWFDEAVSLRWAGAKPFNIDLTHMVPATFRLIEEKHPPVYYLLLYGWRELMVLFNLDQNDAALRFLGALLGVLTVLGMLLLVRRVSGRDVALWAGLFVALSPVLVWYSQELRMFQPAVTFIVWGFYGLMQAWLSPKFSQRILWWLLMIASLVLALYSYLFSAFVLPSVGLCLLLLFLQNEFVASLRWRIPRSDRMRRFVEGAVALAIVGALFFPLARNAWQVNSNESTQGLAFENFGAQTLKLFEILTIWRENWPSLIDNLALFILIGLLVFGLAAPFFQRVTKSTDFATSFFLISWLIGPLLLGNLLLARNSAVFKEDRYHIYLVPFVLWAIALGVVQLKRTKPWVGWLSGGLVAAMLLTILPRFWTPNLLREDWRAAANYIVDYQQRSPDLPSAGVAHISYTHQAMDWYLQQHYSFEELPIFGLFGDPLTTDMLDDVIAPPLNGIVDYGAKTLWLTQSHLGGVDETGVVEGWLRANFPVVTEQYPAGVKLTGFALQSQFAALPTLHDDAARLDAELAPALFLQACEIITPAVPAAETRLHPPAGWVHLRLWWKADVQPKAAYMITAEVVNAEGVWGKKLDRNDDALTHFPIDSWQAGTIMRTELDISLNPETPAGEFDVLVGIVTEGSGDEGSGDEGSGERVSCGKVTIMR